MNIIYIYLDIYFCFILNVDKLKEKKIRNEDDDDVLPDAYV